MFDLVLADLLDNHHQGQQRWLVLLKVLKEVIPAIGQR
jgi:hypothetical protein